MEREPNDVVQVQEALMRAEFSIMRKEATKLLG
jgi:hypothetical protein